MNKLFTVKLEKEYSLHCTKKRKPTKSTQTKKKCTTN